MVRDAGIYVHVSLAACFPPHRVAGGSGVPVHPSEGDDSTQLTSGRLLCAALVLRVAPRTSGGERMLNDEDERMSSDVMNVPRKEVRIAEAGTRRGRSTREA